MIRIAFIFLFVLCLENISGQGVSFSQTSRVPLHQNPALTGKFDGLTRAGTTYRNQWSGFGNGIKTTSIFTDVKFKIDGLAYDNNEGIGICFIKDVAGDLEFGHRKAMLSLSEQIRISAHHFISVGIQGGFGQLAYNPTAQQWGSQYDGNGYNPGLGGDDIAFETVNYLDLHAGLVWSYYDGSTSLISKDASYYEAGVSVQNLNNPTLIEREIFSSTVNPQIIIHGLAIIKQINSKVSYTPSFQVSKQGEFISAIGGGLVNINFTMAGSRAGQYKKAIIGLGAFYRLNDAVIPTIQIEAQNVSFQFSYDYSISKISQSNAANGFELSLMYLLKNS